jgi:hypothetical protein
MQIEEPFGILPLDAICCSLENNLAEMMAEQEAVRGLVGIALGSREPASSSPPRPALQQGQRRSSGSSSGSSSGGGGQGRGGRAANLHAVLDQRSGSGLSVAGMQVLESFMDGTFDEGDAGGSWGQLQLGGLELDAAAAAAARGVEVAAALHGVGSGAAHHVVGLAVFSDSGAPQGPGEADVSGVGSGGDSRHGSEA